MYHVYVYRPGEGQVDNHDFNFGEWSEIGFWLDDHGYNGDAYEVKITFTV
jgi:hypothetical protein